MSGKNIALKWFVLRRILYAIPLIFGVITLAFMLIHTAPGDPIYYIIGEVAVEPEYIEMLRKELGLDKPIWEQYLSYCAGMLTGNFGYSYISRTPVLSLILARIPATFLLLGSSWIVYSFFGVMCGMFVAKKPYSPTDYFVTVISFFGYCMPVFWIGLVLLLVFGFILGWVPPGGITNPALELTGWDRTLDVLHHLVLPATILGFRTFALNTRITRTAMLETLQKDFILGARAKGQKERIVLSKHALRNSLRPILTLISMDFGRIISGAVIVETLFAWPGIGRLAYEAMFSRDYSLLIGTLVFISIGVIVANLLMDVVYAFLDPRVRYK